MWQFIAPAGICVLLLLAGLQAIRGGVHGLRGRRLGMLGRGGGMVYTTGWGARLFGAFALVAGLWLTALGLKGLSLLLADPR